MKITLTFDNGPTLGVTDHVLEILDRRGIKAVFFVLGQNLRSPELYRLARRARAEGHVLGNHSYSHSTPFGELPHERDAIAEIEDTQRLLGALSSDPPLFRPFGGGGHIDQRLLNAAANATLMRSGFTVPLWTSVPRDWIDPEGWPARALADCCEREWSVVVLHDLPTGAMRMLEPFLQKLADLNAAFTTDFPRCLCPIIAGVPQPMIDAVTRQAS